MKKLYLLSFLFLLLFSSCDKVQSYLDKDDFENAILYVDEQTGQDQIDGYFKIAEAYFNKENYDEAVNYFTKANATEKMAECQSFILLNLFEKTTVNDTLNNLITKGQIVELLKNGAKPDISDNKKWTPLHYAVNNCSLIDKILYKKKEELEPVMVEQLANIEKAEKDYKIAKKEADRAKKRGAGALYQMDVLLKANQLDMDVKLGKIAHEANKMILNHAETCFNDSKEIIKLLLENKADLNAENNDGKKPKDFASATILTFIESI